MADSLEIIKDSLIKGHGPEVSVLVKNALECGRNAREILDKALIAGMDVIAQRWRNNEIYMPEVLMAARSMKMAMTQIDPILSASGIEPLGRVAIGTVKGDLHDIGKNLVTMMLRGAGFHVEDMGIDQKPENFIRAVREKNVTLIGLSALITTTMPAMKEVIDAFREVGLRDKVKIAVGGAPVTSEFAREIGADGFAGDAVRAVDLFKSFLNNKPQFHF